MWRGGDPDRLCELYCPAEGVSPWAAGAALGPFARNALVDAMGGSIRAAERPGGDGQTVVRLRELTDA